MTIEDAAKKAVADGDPDFEARLEAHLSGDEPRDDVFEAQPHGKPSLSVVLSPKDSSLRGLLQAQSGFITAHQNYLHDQNLDTLINAQTAYILSMRAVIMNVDPKYLAGLQERMIEMMTDALRTSGVL